MLSISITLSEYIKKRIWITYIYNILSVQLWHTLRQPLSCKITWLSSKYQNVVNKLNSKWTGQCVGVFFPMYNI